MKKRDVEIGGTYTAKVSGKLARVLVTGESPFGGWCAVNLDTKREVRIRGAQRLRRRIDEPAKTPANQERGDAALPTTVAHVKTQTTGQEGDVKMAKQQSKKQGKKVTGKAGAKKSAAKKTTKKKVAPVIRDGVCKACGRFIRVVGKGRCECGQAYLIRGGKLTRINETPNGCVKGLPEAATLKQAEQVKAEVKEAAPKAKRQRKDGKMSGLDAAAQVLAEAGEPLDTKTMVEQMLEKGLWSTSGKTPAATIYAAIIREIAKKGDASRFVKTDRGKFAVAK